MKRKILFLTLTLCALCASAELRFSGLNNIGGTNITLIDTDGRSDLKITDAVFHNNGSAYPVKKVKCKESNGQAVYYLKFKRHTLFSNCYLTMNVDGKKQTIDVQSKINHQRQ